MLTFILMFVKKEKSFEARKCDLLHPTLSLDSVCVSVSVCICLGVYLCVHCIYGCIFIGVCVHVCVRMCTYMLGSMHGDTCVTCVDVHESGYSSI